MKTLVFLWAIALIACKPGSEAQLGTRDVADGNAERGRKAIQKYGCVACHTIDGLSPESLVGPPLTKIASRTYLAGNLENNATNMVRFIQHPRQVHNDTAMPELGVTDEDARDIAAYLYQFK